MRVKAGITTQYHVPVVLGADSRIGMPGELLFECERDALLFATFVQHDHVVARALWAGVQPRHVRVVRSLLERVGSISDVATPSDPADGPPT